MVDHKTFQHHNILLFGKSTVTWPVVRRQLNAYKMVL